jgi:ABC-type dipeptide/oligopeptide/nickel transport system permease subunit
MKIGADRVTIIHLTHPSRRHVQWALLWVAGIALVWGWDLLFLNRPAFAQVRTALFNSLLGGFLVVVFSMILGWACALLVYFLEQRGQTLMHLVLTFVFNLVRSVPQIIGILLGYVFLTALIVQDVLRAPFLQLLSMSLVVSLFVFLEVMDLIRERIEHYKNLDFVDAMLCCGIKEHRIINVEVLRKNSMAHLVHKAVAVFGMAIFLQCSIDFIISVGLSTEVSSANFPVTLGSLLARMDSKQDILAISIVFSNVSYVATLFTRHLQGLNIAGIIVYTLVCTYNIANGLVRRYHL